jgi:CRISPR-associated protein Csm5
MNYFLETFSPIHIGCDEVYEPMGFVLDEKKHQMIVFDTLSFISHMEDADKAKFAQICAKGTIVSIVEIYKFLQNKAAQGHSVDVGDDFIEHYRQTLSLPVSNEKNIQQNLNNFVIPRTAFRIVDQRPYIPGSSIKGALRTAYLNMMESEKKLSRGGKERNARTLEQRLMEYDGIPADPFRMVKVSDFMPVGDIRTRIVYGINEKKTRSDRNARGLPLIFEVIPPNSVFVGTIDVGKPAHSSDIRRAVSLDKLLNSSTLFYAKEKQREDRELKDIGINITSEHTRHKTQQNAFLARLGRHSGAESVTVEGHRDIKIMMGKGKKPKYLDHATTFWLASETRRPIDKDGLQPFGWGQLSRLTDTSLKELQIQEDGWQLKDERKKEIQKEESERKAEAEREKQRLELIKKQKEEERKKREEEKEKMIASMSPEEKSIYDLENPLILEARIYEIFPSIQDFSDESKQKAALLIKEHWQRLGKWEKGSKKQQLKVKKIKEILGEL